MPSPQRYVALLYFEVLLHCCCRSLSHTMQTCFVGDVSCFLPCANTNTAVGNDTADPINDYTFAVVPCSRTARFWPLTVVPCFGSQGGAYTNVVVWLHGLGDTVSSPCCIFCLYARCHCWAYVSMCHGKCYRCAGRSSQDVVDDNFTCLTEGSRDSVDWLQGRNCMMSKRTRYVFTCCMFDAMPYPAFNQARGALQRSEKGLASSLDYNPTAIICEWPNMLHFWRWPLSQHSILTFVFQSTHAKTALR